MRPLSDRLREHLLGPDGNPRAIVEARGVTNADVIQRKDQWQDADSTLGFQISDAGVVRLSPTGSALLDQTAGTDTTEITDMERFPFDSHVGHVALIDWGGDEDPEMPITEVTARLDPGGGTPDVAHWRCQLWQLHEYSVGAQVIVFESVHQLGDYVEADAGASQETVTFSFDSATPPQPKGGAPRRIGSEGTPIFELPEGNPVTLVVIWGVTEDGSKASNTSWVVDTANASLTTDDNRLRCVELVKNVDGKWDATQETFIPQMSISTATFAASATISFTTNPVTLDDLPADPANVVFDIVAGEPGSTSVTGEVREAGVGSFVEFTSGQSAEDLGLGAATSYDIQATLTSGTNNTSTPDLHELSVTDRTSTIIDGPVSVQLQGGWRALLSPALVGEVPEAIISIQKGGERDYRDVASDLLADNEFDQLEFVVYIGFGDESDREHWMESDTFFVDNVRFREAAVDFICLGAMQQLDQVLPVPPDTDNDDRDRKDYENQTLKAVYEDLIQNQALLPDRFFGPGIEDSTTTVTNKISPKDNSNVLQELRAIAALAGGVVTTSQGRVVFRKLHDRGNATDIAAVIPREEITRASISPGYSHRTPRHYMRWKYDFDGSEDFTKEERRTSTQALTAFNPFGLDRDPFAPDYIGRWVDTQPLAATYTRRVTETTGFGLMAWDLEITSLHPELEVGDMAVVNTDLMVARDPTIADRVLRGSQWAVARVTAVGDEWGQRLQVWVQHYSDFIPSGDSGDVTGVVVPKVESASWEMNASRDVSAVVTCNRFSRSIKVATSTSAYPSKATVQAEAAQDLTNNQLETGTLETSVAFQGTVFLSALAYEGTSGAGNESELFKAVMIAGRFSDLDEVPDGTDFARVIAAHIDASNQISGLGTVSTGKLSQGSIVVDVDNEQILFGAATDPTTGTGIFLGLDVTDYEFRVGEVPGAGNDYIHWDGTSLEVGGTITADTFTASLATFNQIKITTSNGIQFAGIVGGVGVDNAGFIDQTDATDAGGGVPGIDIEDGAGNTIAQFATTEIVLHETVRLAGGPTEALEIIDAGSTGATEQDWIEVTVGGNTGYIRVFASQ